MLNVLIKRSYFLLLLAVAMVMAALWIAPMPVRGSDDDTAALYKSKCAVCHGATAEKKFDATKDEGVLVETVLKGKKLEKPPNMPAYEEKGVTADQAKALVTFMKAQKK
ncbi:MAG TPA: cytochrome c [Pyrinomonadaceae bacterium]|nr:cytochrome c [Pyrinomonadaceae bacterium]